MEADRWRHEASCDDLFAGIRGRKLSIFDTEYLKPFVERGSNFKNRIGREDEVMREIRSSIWEIYHEWQQKKKAIR